MEMRNRAEAGPCRAVGGKACVRSVELSGLLLLPLLLLLQSLAAVAAAAAVRASEETVGGER